ncbi:hypothetical protein PTSG_06816 [Salpingoeca rosetta]|uniref:Large ribosomal subunit protein uL24 C-terminal domain-containing protein n=1 Tax=Salpingoeca rosetta (strain ATCC 50818 / BSB-021) TaxID=946362 RepID=F2UEW3_SALR5|nr:uncharacterized protein PTSG_06816 [Salpingoeca rosetta]EGD75163.1 hypothetical protein PTSG_06816 [Salpingoeca rosetta]|eukprot:XP_004992216.1 hypothetical protein PTSG_06816 [Salpingoeca rosetta]
MASHPWTRAAKMSASLARRKFKPPIVPLENWDIVSGDLVEVVAGMKDIGKRGRVKEVIRKKNLLVVEGVNMRTRRIPPSEENPDGGFASMAVPMPYTNVSLIDPTDNKPCDVDYQVGDDGKRARVSTRTNTAIPKPVWKRRDFATRSEYNESPLDTKADVVAAVTYKATVLSFEEDVLRSLGQLNTDTDTNTSTSTTDSDAKQ